MPQTIEATIDAEGHIRWSKPIALQNAQRVLITLLEPQAVVDETLLLSQAALAQEWLNDEEEAAWAHLQ